MGKSTVSRGIGGLQRRRDIPVGGRDIPVGGRDIPVWGRDIPVGGRDIHIRAPNPGGGNSPSRMGRSRGKAGVHSRDTRDMKSASTCGPPDGRTGTCSGKPLWKSHVANMLRYSACSAGLSNTVSMQFWYAKSWSLASEAHLRRRVSAREEISGGQGTG